MKKFAHWREKSRISVLDTYPVFQSFYPGDNGGEKSLESDLNELVNSFKLTYMHNISLNEKYMKEVDVKMEAEFNEIDDRNDAEFNKIKKRFDDYCAENSAFVNRSTESLKKENFEIQASIKRLQNEMEFQDEKSDFNKVHFEFYN